MITKNDQVLWLYRIMQKKGDDLPTMENLTDQAKLYGIIEQDTNPDEVLQMVSEAMRTEDNREAVPLELEKAIQDRKRYAERINQASEEMNPAEYVKAVADFNRADEMVVKLCEWVEAMNSNRVSLDFGTF